MIDERVSLPGGRTLVLRPARPGDVDGLVALYAALSADDLYRRFFSGYRPPRRFLEEWGSIGERGGCLLLALVQEGSRSDRVVGDAGYTLLPDGGGEFAITVAPGYRGWLGPFLLDCLVRVAGERGVPNLQADILVENRSMLALVKARGYVAVDHPDFTIVRVMIGTTGGTPTWPGRSGRPRVLVEIPGAHWPGEELGHTQGWQVIACPGPGNGPTCPVLDGKPCPLAEGADVIVFHLRAGDPRASRILASHAQLHPGTRLVVETDAVDSSMALPAGAIVVPPGLSPEQRVAVVAELLKN
jgi:hypothetical protein